MAIREPRESDIQRAILQYLHALGWPAWRFNSGAATVGDRFVRFHTARGCSDVIAIAPGGVFTAIEVKRGRNEPTPLQESFLDVVRRRGGVAIVARSVNELEAALREKGYLT